jgi:hypothetical protein
MQFHNPARKSKSKGFKSMDNAVEAYMACTDLPNDDQDPILGLMTLLGTLNTLGYPFDITIDDGDPITVASLDDIRIRPHKAQVLCEDEPLNFARLGYIITLADRLAHAYAGHIDKKDFVDMTITTVMQSVFVALNILPSESVDQRELSKLIRQRLEDHHE